jgi:4-amino-4-deoxy-L-arabinose transferase-like glycosyltransferase
MLRKVLWWVNILLGLWIAAAPFALGYQTVQPALYNGVIAGLAVAVLAFIGWLVEQGVLRWGRAPTSTRLGEATGARAA